jgi:CRISPR/Cas system CMR-associated protein Cmr3 (group 5 of RAMP superfamily)
MTKDPKEQKKRKKKDEEQRQQWLRFSDDSGFKIVKKTQDDGER